MAAHDARIQRPTIRKTFFIISPFHDVDAELFRRFTRTWPDAKIEVLAQQGYTTLPVEAMKRLRKVHLYEILDTSRRLHAKLVAWRHRTGDGCLIGSANFTCAAFDGLNVETCLLLTNAAGMVDALFDKELKKQPIALTDFEPGVRQPPPTEDPNLLRLNIESVLLADADTIRVTYSHNLKRGGSLALAIRTPGERHPRISVPLSGKSGVSESVKLPKNALTDASGALLANLVAEIDGESSEGPLVWVIQEDRLTYEPGEGGGTTKRRVEETGEGLHELLDEIGNRDGIHGVIEFLQHFNIQFFDGDGNRALSRRFQIAIRDPFQPDVAPDWLKGGLTRRRIWKRPSWSSWNGTRDTASVDMPNAATSTEWRTSSTSSRRSFGSYTCTLNAVSSSAGSCSDVCAGSSNLRPREEPPWRTSRLMGTSVRFGQPRSRQLVAGSLRRNELPGRRPHSLVDCARRPAKRKRRRRKGNSSLFNG